MSTWTGGATLRPDEAHRARASGPGSQGVPRDLVQQAMPRLRVMALLYAAVFFLAAFFPALITTEGRAILVSAVAQWLLPIPKELDAIVLACLAKDPSDRPQTARELARRLEAVPVKGEWNPQLARGWWDTHQPVA